MPMTPFYTLFPDVARTETRSVTVRGYPGLPDGEYGFIDLYCDKLGCDCRRVIIDVVCSTTRGKIWATINYGWESLEFYEKWMGDKELAAHCRGATLDMLNPQTEYSHVLLRLFENVLKDKAYVERLKRHYEMFKSAVREKHRAEKRQESRGRHVQW
jgi:hypothetical protein